MYKVVRSSRLYEQIVQQIEDSIMKGTLKAGDQLPSERELALKFGVSRTAVREAVKSLHEKGLVEAYSGRGTFITNGTSQAVTQSINLMMRIDQTDGSANLAEVRQILEPEIAALAATRIQEPQLALRAGVEPFPGEPAGTHRDLGLADLVAGLQDVPVGIQERLDPLLLVVLQQEPAGAGEHGDRDEDRDPAARGKPAEEEPDDQERQKRQREAEVGLREDEEKRDADDRSELDECGEAEPRFVFVLEEVGHEDRRRDLGELGRAVVARVPALAGPGERRDRARGGHLTDAGVPGVHDVNVAQRVERHPERGADLGQGGLAVVSGESAGPGAGEGGDQRGC